MYRYILFDLETTGLSTSHARIISIGAKVLTRYGECNVDSSDFTTPVKSDIIFYSLVNPKIPNDAYEFNKIPDRVLAQAKTFPIVIQEFWEWVKAVHAHDPRYHTIFVAHNMDFFDFPIFVKEHERHQTFQFVPKDFHMSRIDTMKLVKYAFPCTRRSIPYGIPPPIDEPIPSSYRQADIYKFLFGQEPISQHSALGDVLALEQILRHPILESMLDVIKSPDDFLNGNDEE